MKEWVDYNSILFMISQYKTRYGGNEGGNQIILASNNKTSFMKLGRRKIRIIKY